MKKNKIIFWVTTAIVAVMMLFSAFSYFTNEEVKNGFIHLGFPAYFRIELAIAKILGATALLLPISARLKDIAYTGFAIVFISAFIAHLSAGDPLAIAFMPLVFLALLIISYLYYHKLAHTKIA